MKRKFSVFMAVMTIWLTVFGAASPALGSVNDLAMPVIQEEETNIAPLAQVSADAVSFGGWGGDSGQGGDINTIVDGIAGNEWYVDGTTSMPFHLDFTFSGEAVIDGVTLTTANLADYMITSITFQYKDGDDWIDITTETYEKDETLGDWDERSKRTDFERSITADTLRLKITGNAAWGAACRIGEIEIWGEFDGDAPVPLPPEEPDETLSNLALKAETELMNASATAGEGNEAINDGNTTSYFSIISDAPGEAVKEIIYDVQPEIILNYPVTAEFSQLEWYSHIDWDGASVLEFAVSYYDAETDSFKTATHSGGKESFVPSLTGRMMFIFDETFETGRIKITLIKSRASWSKSGMLGEIRTYGKWTGDMPPETPEKETNDKSLITDFETESDVNLLTDQEKGQAWTAKVYKDKYMQLHSDDLREIEKIVFYSTKPQEALGKIKVQTNTSSSADFGTACETELGEWVPEGNYYKAELNLEDECLADRNVKLVFDETHEITLTEVEWVGECYSKSDNLLRGIPFYNESEIEDISGIVDGYTPSVVELDFDKSLTADFEGYTATADYVLYLYRDDSGICRYEKVKAEEADITGLYQLPKPEDWTGRIAVSEIYIAGTRSGEGANAGEQTENKITHLDNDLVKIEFAEDKHSFIKNPSTGWVLYIEDCYANPYASDGTEITQGMTTAQYWDKIDELIEQGLTPSILYIRLGWSWFEPEEGNYAWDDPESDIYQLIQGAGERDLQLAFRVLIDSTDNSQQAIPEWVFEKGLQVDSYTSVWDLEHNKELKVKEGKCDDPFFLEHFENFLKAFGERFDTDSSVSHIDAQGMGNWGEVNSICASNKEQAVRTIMDLYRKYFKNVLLGFQIYSEAGSDYGISEQFVMRRDGLGSPVWYGESQKQGIVNEFFNSNNVLYGESCYHGLEHGIGDGGRWSQTNNIVGWSTEQILAYLMDDALSSRANTLDFRMYSDALCWMLDYPEGIQKFVEQGGYRLSPVEMTVTSKAEAGETIVIEHKWKNAGVGRLPNYNPQWDNKYVLNFALLDENGQVAGQIAVSDANPGDWIMESDNEYTTEFEIPAEIKDGSYKIAVSILNQTNVGPSSINLALADAEKSGDWYLLGDISIGDVENSDDEQPGDDDQNGGTGNEQPGDDNSGSGTDKKQPEKDDQNSQTVKAVKTGDNSRAAGYAVVLALAIFAGTVGVRRKCNYKKQQKNR